MNFEPSRPFDIIETREFTEIYRGLNENGQPISFWRPIAQGAFNVGDVFIQTDHKKPEMVANMIAPNPKIEGYETMLRVPDGLNHIFTTGSYAKTRMTANFSSRNFSQWQSIV